MNCKTAKIEYTKLLNIERKLTGKIGHLNKLLSGEVADPDLIPKLTDELTNAQGRLREVQTTTGQLATRYGFLKKDEDICITV